MFGLFICLLYCIIKVYCCVKKLYFALDRGDILRIVWRDSNRKDNPNPKMNELEKYINISNVNGIDQAYSDAINEYIAEYNLRAEELAALRKENYKLKIRLEHWEKNQHGRKSVLNDINKKSIESKKEKGLSNRQIAKELNISEGTVRNYLKSKS